MLDALLEMAKNGLRGSAQREMQAAIGQAREAFAFLEELGFSATAEHRGDSFDFIWVEYERSPVIARVTREKTYWEFSLRRTDKPEVKFDAIEAFPLIGLGGHPCLPYGHRTLEGLASTISRAIQPLLELATEAGMDRIGALRSGQS